MIVVAFIGLLKPAFATKCNHVIFDGQVEIFLLHSGKLCLKDNLVLVFVYVDAGSPCASADGFVIAKSAGQISRKQPINFFLKRSQISERVVPNYSHCTFSSLDIT